jgi:uncharacterized membrane protein
MENKKEQKKKLVLWTILTLSIAGFADATFLAMQKLVGSPIACSGSNGCGVVDASTYSSVWGIPLALLGSIFYAVTILLLVQYLLRRQKKIFKIASAVLIAGGVFSIYLIVLQAFVIKAWCYYCIISDTIGIINTVLIVYLIKKEK